MRTVMVFRSPLQVNEERGVPPASPPLSRRPGRSSGTDPFREKLTEAKSMMSALPSMLKSIGTAPSGRMPASYSWYTPKG